MPPDIDEDGSIVTYEEYYDENLEDNVEQGHHNSVLECDELLSEDHDGLTFEVNMDCGLREHTVVQRIDVIRDGNEVRPIDDIGKAVVSRLREVYSSKMKEKVPSLKKRNKAEVKEQIRLVNGVVENISWQCKTISEVNQLLHACSFVVAERLGLTKKRKGGRKEKEDPW